jgi:adenylate kinase
MMKSKVIGIYGVSGSGKSRMLSESRKSRPEWRCVEGTDVIRQIMEDKGGFVAFEAMDEANKTVIRSQAAKRLQEFSGITVVAGHCSFARVVEVDVSGETVVFEDVFTSEDTETYDFVLYLDKDPEVVWKQREADTRTSKRARPALSSNVIRRWMEHEKAVLHDLCKEHGIYFAILSHDTDPASHIDTDILPALVEAAQNHSHEALCQTVRALPEADIYLLVDGDRTLFAGDLGSMFFAAVKGDTVDYLKPIFKRYPSYTFQAFLEISMLYGNSVQESDYLRLSNAVGCSPNVGLYTQWLAFLDKLPPNVHPVLLTR